MVRVKNGFHSTQIGRSILLALGILACAPPESVFIQGADQETVKKLKVKVGELEEGQDRQDAELLAAIARGDAHIAGFVQTFTEHSQARLNLARTHTDDALDAPTPTEMTELTDKRRDFDSTRTAQMTAFHATVTARPLDAAALQKAFSQVNLAYDEAYRYEQHYQGRLELQAVSAVFVRLQRQEVATAQADLRHAEHMIAQMGPITSDATADVRMEEFMTAHIRLAGRVRILVNLVLADAGHNRLSHQEKATTVQFLRNRRDEEQTNLQRLMADLATHFFQTRRKNQARDNAQTQTAALLADIDRLTPHFP